MEGGPGAHNPPTRLLGCCRKMNDPPASFLLSLSHLPHPPPSPINQCTFETQPTPNETILCVSSFSPCLATHFVNTTHGAGEPNAGRGKSKG